MADRPNIRKTTGNTIVTAAIASGPNRPTKMASTMLKAVCRDMATAVGQARCRMLPAMLPLVRSLLIRALLAGAGGKEGQRIPSRHTLLRGTASMLSARRAV
jgi:hypothetical protein